MSIDLAFNTAMARGTGTIFVTDGAVQTVIDRTTGQPTMRIVGATVTREISASNVTIDGTHVKFDVSDLQGSHNYSVVMDPGVLVTAANKPFAGLRTPGQVAFTTPLSVAKVELDGSTLSAGHNLGVTITFSQAVAELDPAAIATPGARLLGGLQKVGDGTVWHLTLAGAEPTNAAANAIGINLAMVRDLAGNPGSGIYTSTTYAVDTVAPTATVSLDGDALRSDNSIGVTIKFSEAVAEPSHAAIQVPDATLGPLTSDDGGITWKGTLAAAGGSASTGNRVSIDMSKVLDLHGNAGSGSASSATNYVVDTIPPSATVTLDGTLLSTTHAIGVTIRFTEALPDLDTSVVHAGNATLTGWHTDDSGTTWQATLTPAANTSATENSVSIDMSKVHDHAGNTGSGKVSSPNYAVDTVIGAVLEPQIQINDLGAIRADYITADAERYLSGNFTGLLLAGQHIKLAIDGVAVDSEDIHTEVNGETSVNGWYYQGSGDFADGVYNVTAWIEDGAGKSGPVVSQVITIDTHKPTFTSSAGTGTPFDVTSPLVITFSEPVYWDSHGADHQVIRLANVSDNSTSEIYVDERNLSADRRTLTINADDLHLLDAKDYRVTLPISIIDLAGNELGENEITFHTQGAYVDLAGPRALRADATIDGSSPGTSFGAGTVITIRVRFSEPVQFAGAPLPTLGLNNGAHAGSATISEDKLEVSFRYTVADGDGDTQHLAILDTSALVGRIADLAGNLLTAADIGYLGFDDDEAIPIDTHAPAPLAAARVAGSSDTGTSESDGITSISTPTLGGSGAETDALDIRIYEGASLIGHGNSNDDGTWSATINTASRLTDGVHTLVVKQVDQAGHESAGSPAVTVTVDTTPPPALPAPLGDSGVISHSTPTFTGSGAAADSIIKLYASTNGHEFEAGHTVSGADGTWSIPADKLDDGSYSISVKQFDAAGNVSPASPAVAVTIDTVPPAAPSEPVLEVNSDKGVSSSDGITYITTPTLTGNALPNSVVKLYAGETEIGNGVSNAQGGWSVATSTLVDGAYTVTARQFDVAGNRSDASGPVNVRIDTAGPTVIGNHEEPKAGDFSVLFSEAITLTPGASLRVLNSLGLVVSTLLGSAPDWQVVNDGAGAASILRFHSDALLPGIYHLQLASESIHDLAGNAAIIGQPEFEFHINGIFG